MCKISLCQCYQNARHVQNFIVPVLPECEKKIFVLTSGVPSYKFVKNNTCCHSKVQFFFFSESVNCSPQNFSKISFKFLKIFLIFWTKLFEKAENRPLTNSAEVGSVTAELSQSKLVLVLLKGGILTLLPNTGVWLDGIILIGGVAVSFESTLLDTGLNTRSVKKKKEKLHFQLLKYFRFLLKNVYNVFSIFLKFFKECGPYCSNNYSKISSKLSKIFSKLTKNFLQSNLLIFSKTPKFFFTN